MTRSKKSTSDYPRLDGPEESIDNQSPSRTEIPLEQEEATIRDTHDKVIFSATQFDAEDLLAEDCLEYQLIMSLHQALVQADRSSFPVDCGKDGTYYLSLQDGYLCFLQNPQVRGCSFWLADRPKTNEADLQADAAARWERGIRRLPN